MKHRDKAILKLVISGETPETLPLAQAAEYLLDLARLIGNTAQVHLVGITKGSAVLSAAVTEAAYPLVIGRLRQSGFPDASDEIAKAYKALDSRLRAHGVSAKIRGRDGGDIVVLPGAKRRVELEVSLKQPSVVDGVVVRIGGTGGTIPVHLQDWDGTILPCHVKDATKAKELAPFLYSSPLRVAGIGSWTRPDDGSAWKLTELEIQTWEVLEELPAAEIFDGLRRLTSNGWTQIEDPIGEWKALREH